MFAAVEERSIKLRQAKRAKRDCEDEKAEVYRRRGVSEVARRKVQSDIEAAVHAQHEAEHELFTLLKSVRAAREMRPELALLLLDEVSAYACEGCM